MTAIQRNQQIAVISFFDLQEKYPSEAHDHKTTEQQMQINNIELF